MNAIACVQSHSQPMRSRTNLLRGRRDLGKRAQRQEIGKSRTRNALGRLTD